MNKPNIFDFATSELSQDAVLAYILSWADKKHFGDKGGMHALGQNFAKWLLGMHKNLHAPASVDTVKVAPQYRVKNRNADVVAVINANFALLIEDKTGSTVHSGQLVAYRDGRGRSSTKKTCFLSI